MGRLPFLFISCLIVSACINPRSYPDPSVPPISYEDVQRIPNPIRATVVVQFQRQGQPYPRAEPEIRDTVLRTLRGTGVIMPSEGPVDGTITILLNNVGDTSDAVARGVGTGLTLGAVGSTVRDGYEMTVTIATSIGTASRSGIRHGMFTAIGNTSLPAGVQPAPPIIAVQKVIEAMLLAALRDMQQSGELSRLLNPRVAGLALNR